MTDCTFKLNNKPMSIFRRGSTSFPAFSGLGEHVNSKFHACIPNRGPIPPGTYYIIDRQSGGLIGPLRDLFTDRDTWFALYAIDEKIDDETFCNDVKRGLFRLHPKGSSGRSEGCVVIDKKCDFLYLRAKLQNTPKSLIPNTGLESYGRLVVT